MEHSAPGSPAENVVQWLEEEQRQTKAALFRLQQQTEQLQNGIWSIAERLNTVEGSIAGVMGHSVRVARTEEDVRAAREVLERLQTTLQDHVQSTEVDERARTAELERERLSRAELSQKIDSVSRLQESTLERIMAVEELHRRSQQELFRVAADLEPLRAQDERLMSLITALQATAKRQETDVAEVQKDQQSLHAQDEVVQGRVHNLVDQVRRIEGNAEVHDLEERLTRDMREQAELNRIERQRQERLVVDLEQGYDQARTNIENLQQELTQTAGRTKAFADHLEHLRQQLWDLRTDLSETLAAVAATQEQHYRRSVAEVELQLRELGQWRMAPPRT